MPAPNPFHVIREAAAIWLAGWFQWVSRCILWVLCCFTVILAPPATFALAYAAHYAVHGVELSLGELAAAARQQFWQSWLWMFLNLAAAGVVWAGARLGEGIAALGWAALALGLVWLVVQVYTLPLFMGQDRKSIFLALGNGARAAFSAPLFTAVAAGFALAVEAVSLLLVAPLALGGPGLVAVLATRAAFERQKTLYLEDD